jgi:hypothetical protein
VVVAESIGVVRVAVPEAESGMVLKLVPSL